MTVCDKPIIFSGSMVRAILDGRKTQTRRVYKHDVPEYLTDSETSDPDFMSTCAVLWAKPFLGKLVWWMGASWGAQPVLDRLLDKMPPLTCPYGVTGTRLYVKEACWIWGAWRQNGLTKTGRQKWRFYEIDPCRVVFEKPSITAKRNGEHGWVYRHARFMPRWASRITLEVKAVRVERVQDITPDDAVAEGMMTLPSVTESHLPDGREYLRNQFRITWDSINAARGYGWAVNPWVWVVKFRRVQP